MSTPALTARARPAARRATPRCRGREPGAARRGGPVATVDSPCGSAWSRSHPGSSGRRPGGPPCPAPAACPPSSRAPARYAIAAWQSRPNHHLLYDRKRRRQAAAEDAWCDDQPKRKALPQYRERRGNIHPFSVSADDLPPAWRCRCRQTKRGRRADGSLLRATRLPSAAAPHRVAKAGRVGCADRRLKAPSRTIFFTAAP